ncbi:MAG: polysaccharide deacetylase family protein [Bacteroidota bacterium]|nr:polysaccharide deacetylase family protein [Bacteroidota bacterium]
MNLRTNSKKRNNKKCALLMLSCITTFSLSNSVSAENNYNTVRSNLANRVSTVEKANVIYPDDYIQLSGISTDNNLVIDKKTGVPVLLFHKFVDSPKDIEYPDTEITLDYFKNVLEYLKVNKYSTISYQQLYSYIKDGTPIPKNSIVLSIDDGFYADGAIKLLKEYNMHADIAVVGERQEKGTITDPKDYYTWEQIIDLAQDKDGDIIDVTDHTPQHADLVEVSKNPDELKQLFKSSMNIFKQEVGSSSDILVYPYGSYNKEIEEIAAQSGYKMGVTIEEGLNYYGDNPFEIKRYSVNPNISVEEIFNKINSDSLNQINNDNNNIEKSNDNNPDDNLVIDKETGVPVLLFHKFVDSPKDVEYPDTEITLDYFRNVLEYLKQNNYSTISYQELYSYIKDGTPIPKNSIVLSIDDGFYADGAIKLLKEYNMHADLAVVGERQENGIITDPKDYYSWEQVASLAQDKDGDIIDVVDHTPQHEDLENLSKKPNKLKQLFKSSMNLFKQKLGSSSDILVYPYGSYDKEIENVAAQSGYKMGVTTDEGLNYYEDNPFEIKRYIVNENVSIEDMFNKINGDASERENSN